jgi:hypothetical protein
MEANAAILSYRSQSWGDSEWKSVTQRVPITWKPCHLGGHDLGLSARSIPMDDTDFSHAAIATASP